jgi:hypothetical protein
MKTILASYDDQRTERVDQVESFGPDLDQFYANPCIAGR